MVSVVMLVLSRPHSEYILAVFAGKTVSVFIPQCKASKAGILVAQPLTIWLTNFGNVKT